MDSMRIDRVWMAAAGVIVWAAGFAPAQGYVLATLTAPVGTGIAGKAVTGLPDIDADGVPEVAVTVDAVPPSIVSGVMFFSGATGARLFRWNSDSGPGFGTTLAGGLAGGSPVVAIGNPTVSVLVPGSNALSGLIEIAHLGRAHGVPGTAAGEHLGASVAGVGDVNGDFVADYIAGAPDFTSAIVQGRVRIISGRDASVIRSHSGILTNGAARFGAAVAGIGDVNGDQVPDYAVGDPLADTNGADSGQVRVFSGATGTAFFSVSGAAAGERFGASLAGVGQVHLPGGPLVQGLAVGAPFATNGGLAAVGRVAVLNGATGATLYNLPGSAHTAAAGAHFGETVALGNSPATAGSGNDLLVGAPDIPVNGLAAVGRIFGFSLSSGALTLNVTDPSPAPGERLGEGLASESGSGRFAGVGRFANPFGGGMLVMAFDASGAGLWTHSELLAPGGGSTAAFAGDYDGDGRRDLALGTPGLGGKVLSGDDGLVIPGSEFAGHVLAAIGDPTANPHRNTGFIAGDPTFQSGALAGAGRVKMTPAIEPRVILGGADNRRFGSALAFVNDLDGDGHRDLAVGAPNAQTNGLIANGLVKVWSGDDHALLLTVHGLVAGENSGASVCDAGDVNGDSVADLAIGSPSADGVLGLSDVGRVRWRSGADGSQIRSNAGSTANGRLGAALAPLGDVDGDGVGDVAAGMPFLPASLQAGSVRTLSGATGAPLHAVSGTGSGSGFGEALAAVGDLDGDGRADFAVGAPRADSFGPPDPDSGQVTLHSGATGSVFDTIKGPQVGGARFGAAVSAAGDLDADCRTDLVAGAPGASVVRLVSRSGIPSGSAIFGSGCAGSGGFVPRISTFGGTPSSAGNTAFGLTLSCALGGANTFLIAGTSDTVWNGNPLPFDLATLGVPQCRLFVSADVLIPLPASGAGPGAGFVSFPVPIPADPALSGVQIFTQWFVLDFGAANAVAAMSPALGIIIQALP